MRNIQKYTSTFIVLIASIITITFSIIPIFKTDIFKEFDNKYIVVITTTLAVIITTISIQVLQTFRKNPVSITISLLGFPNVGKTVFLTMLYEELQKSRDNYINFSPYGNETIEKVLTDINSLRSGVWLPSTPISQVFFYRAYATLKTHSPFLNFPRKFKVEFADYAGENIDEFNPQKENWLHKTEYFQYALQSDGIFLALDCNKFLKNLEQFRNEINGLIAAIQILAEKKGAVEGNKAIEPISILFLKADVLNKDIDNEQGILREVDRLVSICQNRFKYVKYFFVSSTGELKDGKLSSNLTPINVIEPLIWLLRNNRLK